MADFSIRICINSPLNYKCLASGKAGPDQKEYGLELEFFKEVKPEVSMFVRVWRIPLCYVHLLCKLTLNTLCCHLCVCAAFILVMWV